MSLLLMRTGKQILRLSSSSSAVAVAARSQQQLSKGVTAAASCMSFTRSIYMVSTSPYVSTKNKQHQEDDNFEIPKKTWKSFFTNLFRASPPPPPTPTPFQEIFGKFMDLSELSKHYPEDRLPSILDDIRPVLTEMLYRMSDEGIVKYVYEFARPAASSPPVVIDRKIKAIVDELPSHVIHLFIDLMVETFLGRYNYRSSYEMSFHSIPNSLVYTADVSHIGKEHLKLFVLGNKLLVTGTAKDAPPASPRLLALRATVHNLLVMPSWPYSRDEITASIVEEQGKSQLKIIVPIHDQTEVVADKPRVFQLNLTRVQTRYEFSGKS